MSEPGDHASAGELRRSLVELGPREIPIRARLLHRLAWVLRDRDAALAHDLAAEAVHLARRLDDADAEAEALDLARRLDDAVGPRRAQRALEASRGGHAAGADARTPIR